MDHGSDPLPLVDWARTAKRLRTSAVVAVTLAAVGWAISLAFSGPRAGTWLGLALGLVLVSELVIVGGSALRGMLRAGDRGERLAGRDVGLLPPRRKRRAGPDDT